MKIELYTCDKGLDLYKKGMNFGAWKKTADSFKDTAVNIKILVDEKDIRPCDDGYNIINIKSVEVIGTDFIQKENYNMVKHNHMVEKDCTLQFYKGEDRMKVDIEGFNIFVLRDKNGVGFLLNGYDEIDDVISLLTKIKQKQNI